MAAFGKYHPDVGYTYILFANLYSKLASRKGRYGAKRSQKDCVMALNYYQKAIQSLVKGFSYSNIYVNPILPTNYEIKEGRGKVNSRVVLLDALMGKAEALYGKWNNK